jgi:hypothetical protein
MTLVYPDAGLNGRTLPAALVALIVATEQGTAAYGPQA